jgi:L-lysine 2,3-aminomutase
MAVKGGQDTAQSRNLALLAKDVMEGFVTMNPLILKKYDANTCKELHRQLRKMQNTIRTESVDLANQAVLRTRNHRLQRMLQALTVLEHYAKTNQIILG